MRAREYALYIPVDVLCAQSGHRTVVGTAQAVVVCVTKRGWLQCAPLFF